MKKNLLIDFSQGTPSDMTSMTTVSIAEAFRLHHPSISSLIFIFPQLNYEDQPILRERKIEALLPFFPWKTPKIL